MATDFDWASTATQLATSGVGTVIGAFLGYRLAISAHVREKRHDFIVEQLRDFYAPMLSLRDEISTTTNRCRDLRHDHFDPDYFYEHVWPSYQKLASTFSEKLWLASPSTRKFHPLVIKTIGAFQELIDNDLVDNGHIEWEQERRFEVLTPFYDHLDQTLDALQRKLLPDG